MSGIGRPSVEFDVTVTGNKLGNFYPRIAASTRAQRVDDGDVDGVRPRQRTAHQDTGPRWRSAASAAPAATAAADRAERAERPNGSWFLAEGAESGRPTGFQTFYLVTNEHDDPVDARAWFAGDDGTLKYREFEVAARSRATISLASVANGAFGAIFQSRTPGRDIYVARSIYSGPELRGQHRRVGGQGPGHELVLRRGLARRRAVRQLLPRLQPFADADDGERDVPHLRRAGDHEAGTRWRRRSG